MNSDWLWKGSYIPFPLPIATPGVAPFSSQDVSICVAEAWRPALLGVLKALARSETWKDDDPANIEAAVQGGYQILAGLLPCGVPCTAFDATFELAASPNGVYVAVPQGSIFGTGLYQSDVGYLPSIIESTPLINCVAQLALVLVPNCGPMNLTEIDWQGHINNNLGDGFINIFVHEVDGSVTLLGPGSISAGDFNLMNSGTWNNVTSLIFAIFWASIDGGCDDPPGFVDQIHLVGCAPCDVPFTF